MVQNLFILSKSKNWIHSLLRVFYFGRMILFFLVIFDKIRFCSFVYYKSEFRDKEKLRIFLSDLCFTEIEQINKEKNTKRLVGSKWEVLKWVLSKSVLRCQFSGHIVFRVQHTCHDKECNAPHISLFFLVIFQLNHLCN